MYFQVGDVSLSHWSIGAMFFHSAHVGNLWRSCEAMKGLMQILHTKPNAYWQCKQIFCSFATSRQGSLQESCFVEVFGASNGIHGLKWSSYGYANVQTIILQPAPNNSEHATPNSRMGKEREHDSLHTDSRLSCIYQSRPFWMFFGGSNISLDCRRSFSPQDTELRLSCKHVHFNKTPCHQP